MKAQNTLNVAGSIIGILLILILGFLSGALVFISIPASNETALNVLLGILSTQVGMVIGFYFGSSSTQKRQTDALADQADAIKTAQAALAVAPANVIQLDPGQAAQAPPENTDAH